MNKPPDNEELKRECSYPCGIHSVPTLNHSMYDGAKKIRDQWAKSNGEIVERLEDIKLKLSGSTWDRQEARTKLYDLINELKA